MIGLLLAALLAAGGHAPASPDPEAAATAAREPHRGPRREPPKADPDDEMLKELELLEKMELLENLELFE